ncbi:MAG TPA: RsmG family class I SAM-dependent methyltransferase [Candidatus Binataceae bacterium]|nr:RsmG family class I SAM-dependent methyltransferase [Candidatus Binataceae bacterium]
MAATLALWGRTTNLTANPTDPAELAFHVIDSLAPVVFAEGAARAELDRMLASDRAALDLGSGAGFPGLVLAAAFETRFTLAEARRKRASYLQVAANEMGLGNVTIERRTLTVGNIGGGFDLVTARAFGAGDDIHAIAAAALRPGGLMLLYASEDQGRDQERGGHRVLEVAFESPVTWKYRLPRSDRTIERAAILRRRARRDS